MKLLAEAQITQLLDEIAAFVERIAPASARLSGSTRVKSQKSVPW
jgi:hypothetical protein